MHELHTRRRIEFSDTDMAGIVHFARFFIFMETAEHEFLAALGTSVSIEENGQKIGWPRVAATCDYLAPARFGDLLDLRVKVLRKGRTSLTFAHEISRSGTPIARGQITSVCCRFGPEGAKPIPIPPGLAEKIEEAGDLTPDPSPIAHPAPGRGEKSKERAAPPSPGGWVGDGRGGPGG